MNEPVPSHRTFDAMAGMFGWMFRAAECPFGFLEGKSFLEIGTGQYMNHPMAALVCGASEVWTHDIKDNRTPNQEAPFDNVVMANRFLSDLVGQGFFTDRMKERSLDDVVFTTEWPRRKFDVMFSYSVLEHLDIESVGSVLLGIRNALCRFGMSLHYIDITDKNRANDYASKDWKNLFELINWNVEIPFTASDGSYMVIKTT